MSVYTFLSFRAKREIFNRLAYKISRRFTPRNDNEKCKLLFVCNEGCQIINSISQILDDLEKEQNLEYVE